MKVVFVFFAYWTFLINPVAANSQSNNQNVPEVPPLTDPSIYTNTVIPKINTSPQTRDSNLPSVNQPATKSETGSLAGNQPEGSSTNSGTPVIAPFISINTQTTTSTNTKTANTQTGTSTNTKTANAQTGTSTNTETANTQSEKSNQNEGAIRSFFSNLADKFRNIVNLFRGEAKKNQKQADLYQEKADAYQAAADTYRTEEEKGTDEMPKSAIGRIFQKMANGFHRAVAWFRDLASQNQKQAHLFDKKADIYERLSWPKALQMADCLARLQKETLKRDRESLLESGVSYNNIVCPDSSYPMDSNIWDASYPERAFPCQDNTPHVGRIITYTSPLKINPSGQTLTEEEKTGKVKECLGILAEERNKRRDNRSGWQVSCLHKKAHEVNSRQRGELRNQGYSPTSCSSLEDLIIAVIENDTVATAYQVGGCFGIKEGDLGLKMPYETVQCKKDPELKMAICLDKLQKETHKKSKQELLMQGVAYNDIKCPKHTFHDAPLTELYIMPFSYINSCYRKSFPAPGIPMFGQSGAFSAEQKQAMLEECETRLTATKEWLKQNREVAHTLGGSCISDKAAEIDQQQKEELASSGISFQRCHAPEDYLFVTTNQAVIAYGVGGCSGISTDSVHISRPFKTVECPLLVAPPPIAENWDECVKQTMRGTVNTIRQTLQDQGVPAESITCNGHYGSDRGWKVSCSSANGGSATESDYQPYSATCGIRPTRAVASSSSGSQ